MAHAVTAAKGVISTLPHLAKDLRNGELRERMARAATMWSTDDGADWLQEIGPSGRLAPDGIGDLMNYGIRSLVTYRDELLIGTAQCFYCELWPVTGAEVWRRIAECEPPPPPPPPTGCERGPMG